MERRILILAFVALLLGVSCTTRPDSEAAKESGVPVAHETPKLPQPADLDVDTAYEVVPENDQVEQEGLVLRRLETGVMGTELILQVIGPQGDTKRLDAALSQAEAEIQRVEDLMTDWRASPLTTLNESAGQGPQVVPAELARLIARAQSISALTGGAFDATYASVGKLWDFKAKPPRIPTAPEIEVALDGIGWDRVIVDLEASTVELPAGMKLGLGGIAKGYGVDRAMAVLLEAGIDHGMVNAGGDLKALGRRFGKSWEIAIRHPRRLEGAIAVLPVVNQCVVTSGDYLRFFEHAGKRYHHIIDPRTGYPSTGCISATVVAPDAAFADALATALSVLPWEEGLEIVEGMDRVEALVVDLDGVVHYSTGLAGER